MAYYFSNCGGFGALLLDTSSGASPEDFDYPESFVEIGRDRYEMLLADQCSGYCIQDDGTGEPTTQSQDTSPCTCVVYPQSVHAAGVMSSGSFMLDAEGEVDVEADGFAVRMSSSGMEVIRDPWGSREGYELATSTSRQNTGNEQDFASSKPTLQPLADYGMDLGSTNRCWEIIHCKGIKTYGTIDASGLKISGSALESKLADFAMGGGSGGVGSIGLFLYTGTTSLNYGGSVSGSSLYRGTFKQSSGTVSFSSSGTTVSGTWAVLNNISNSSGQSSLVLAVRTA